MNISARPLKIMKAIKKTEIQLRMRAQQGHFKLQAVLLNLMDKSGDYQSIHSILNTLLVYYGVCPELDYTPDYLQTQMDDMISALNDYTTNRNPAELYTRLKNVRVEILKMQQEDAERHGISF